MDRQEIMTKVAAWMLGRGWKHKIAKRLLVRTDGSGWHAILGAETPPRSNQTCWLAIRVEGCRGNALQ